MSNPKEYIENIATKSTPVAEVYKTAAGQYNKKLWHQLTLTLVKLLENDYWTNEKNYAELRSLYTEFIQTFETKINKLKLAQFVVAVSDTMEDVKESFDFIESKQEQLKGDNEAMSYVYSAQAAIRLRADEQKDCKKLLDLSNTHLSNVAGGEAAVPAAYYRVLFEYHKIRSEALEFYHASLTYLAHEPAEGMTQADQTALATDMALAALVGEKIYNFGELLNHPVFESIKDDWLGQLLRAVNAGDIEEFDRVMDANKAKVAEQSVLVSSEQTLREKLSILALLTLALGRGANARILQFNDIASACRLDVDEVELLLMKALSLGLIRGSIDQVEQHVTVTWVQPRVLDMKQLTVVADRLTDWSGQVGAQVASIQQQMPQGVLV